jgi:hypothetical protein
LCAVGACFALGAYYVMDSVPLTAVGLSAVVIGIVCIALPNYRPYVSPEAWQILLQAEMENTAALLEGLGISSRALYLPSSMTDGRSQTIIPLKDRDKNAVPDEIPGRLLTRYGTAPGDTALVLTTPGNMSIRLLKTAPGPTPEEIEGAASHVLIGVLDLADSVTVGTSDAHINVLVRGARLSYEETWHSRCLGSPIASVVAAICSEALGKPVRIARESCSRGVSRIEIEVLS